MARLEGAVAGQLQRLVIRRARDKHRVDRIRSSKIRQGLNGFARLFGEAGQFVRFEQAEAVDYGELDQHRGALRAIESACNIVITICNEPKELAKAFMKCAGRVRDYAFNLMESALTQTIERDLAKLSEHSPVRLGKSMRHPFFAV